MQIERIQVDPTNIENPATKQNKPSTSVKLTEQPINKPSVKMMGVDDQEKEIKNLVMLSDAEDTDDSDSDLELNDKIRMLKEAIKRSEALEKEWERNKVLGKSGKLLVKEDGENESTSDDEESDIDAYKSVILINGKSTTVECKNESIKENESETENESESEDESGIEDESKSDDESMKEDEVESKMENELKTESESEVEYESEAEDESENEDESEAENESETESMMENGTESMVEEGSPMQEEPSSTTYLGEQYPFVNLRVFPACIDISFSDSEHDDSDVEFIETLVK